MEGGYEGGVRGVLSCCLRVLGLLRVGWVDRVGRVIGDIYEGCSGYLCGILGFFLRVLSVV